MVKSFLNYLLVLYFLTVLSSFEAMLECKPRQNQENPQRSMPKLIGSVELGYYVSPDQSFKVKIPVMMGGQMTDRQVKRDGGGIMVFFGDNFGNVYMIESVIEDRVRPNFCEFVNTIIKNSKSYIGEELITTKRGTKTCIYQLREGGSPITSRSFIGKNKEERGQTKLDLYAAATCFQIGTRIFNVSVGVTPLFGININKKNALLTKSKNQLITFLDGLVISSMQKDANKWTNDDRKYFLEEFSILFESFCKSIERAGTAKEAAIYCNNFSDGLKKMFAGLKAYIEKRNLLKGQDEGLPEELKGMEESFDKDIYPRYITAMKTKSVLFGNDPEILKGTAKIEKIMAEIERVLEFKEESKKKVSAYAATMQSLKSIGNAIKDYIKDNNSLPEANSIEELAVKLMPFYIKVMPRKDEWQNRLYYKYNLKKGEHGTYWIGSSGSDGKFEGFDQEGIYTDPEGKDLILSNGKLVYYPHFGFLSR